MAAASPESLSPSSQVTAHAAVGRTGRWRRPQQVGEPVARAAPAAGLVEFAAPAQPASAASEAGTSVNVTPPLQGERCDEHLASEKDASDAGSALCGEHDAAVPEKQSSSTWRARGAVQGGFETKLAAIKVGERPGHVGPDSAVALRSGLVLPLLGLGTRQLNAGAECRDAVRAALRCGYRLLDTSPVYGNEEDVRHGIRAAGLRREDVFLVSKLPAGDHGDHEDVREALEASLQRLGTSYVDLYLIQSPKGGSLLETWDAMLEMRACGLARALGVSNFNVSHLQRLAATGREVPEVVQVELHFGLQQRPLASYCAREGIAIMASSPLARGRLFGSGTPLGALARRKGRTEAEIAVRWCLQRGFVTIPKSKVTTRIEANAALGFSLSASEMAEIDALDRGYAVSSTTRIAGLPWEELLQEVSEVSEEDAEGGRAPQRRRRRRRRKGKGKGKSAGAAAAGTGVAGRGRGGGKAGGSTATRWSDTLASLS